MDDTQAAVTVTPLPERKPDRRETLSARIEALTEQLRTIGRSVETLVRDIKGLKESL